MLIAVIIYRLLFELYIYVLSIYHKDATDQFAQNSALALTNCLYLAHQCVTLTLDYQTRFPEPLNDQFLTFADMLIKVSTKHMMK